MKQISRDMKIDLAIGVIGGMATAAVCALLFNCTPSEGVKYGARLEECNREAKTLCESIVCENKWRALASRPLRELPNTCIMKDAGADGQ